MRSFLIVPKEWTAAQAEAQRLLSGVPEICHGIPPALAGQVQENQLPLVVTEPDPPPSTPSPEQQAFAAASPAEKILILARRVGLA